MLAAISFNSDKFQTKPRAWLTAAHHRVCSNRAFLHQKMQIRHLTFRKWLFRFKKHSARADIADSRHIRTRNALPVDPDVAVCLNSRRESSAGTYADQTAPPSGLAKEILLLKKSKIFPAKTRY